MRPKFVGCLPINPALPANAPKPGCSRLQPQGRPRALLQANRLLVAALSAAGRTDEAKQTLANIAAQCAERGMVRYLLDGGPRVVALLAELRDDMHSGRWRPTLPPIPPAFLDTHGKPGPDRQPRRCRSTWRTAMTAIWAPSMASTCIVVAQRALVNPLTSEKGENRQPRSALVAKTVGADPT